MKQTPKTPPQTAPRAAAETTRAEEIARILQERGARKLSQQDLPPGYAAGLVFPHTQEEAGGRLALAYREEGGELLLTLIVPEVTQEHDAATLLQLVRCASLPQEGDSRDMTDKVRVDVRPSRVYLVAAFEDGAGQWAGYVQPKTPDAAEFLATLAELPPYQRRAIHRASRCAPEERYQVAYAALADCGQGDAVRQELARKAAQLGAVLAQEKEG